MHAVDCSTAARPSNRSSDDIIEIRPYDHPMLEFFEMLVVVQLLAKEIAIRLDNDVNMPRNLAKSVMVE